MIKEDKNHLAFFEIGRPLVHGHSVCGISIAGESEIDNE